MDQIAEAARQGEIWREEDHQAFLSELGVDQYQSYCRPLTPIEEPDASFRATARKRRKHAEEVLTRHTPVVPRPVVKIVLEAVLVTPRRVVEEVPGQVPVAPDVHTVKGMTVRDMALVVQVPVIKSALTLVPERLQLMRFLLPKSWHIQQRW